MDSSKGEIPRTNTSSSTRSFISRTSFSLSRKGAGDAAEREPPKGPLGLTTLYIPPDEKSPVADLVFVHGLNGGSHSTWSKGNSAERFWPRRWLPEDDAFKDVRIHTFGYPSGVTRESIINISDISRSLLAAVNDSPVMNKGKQPRLIFVAHSMGGLIVKKAYILGSREPEFKPVVDRVCSIFFLATPHQGAAIAQTLSRLTAVVGLRPFVEDLFPQSPLIQSISEDFPRVCGNIQLFSFYETRPMSVGVNKMLIVEKSSAVMNLANERRTFLDADHRNVAMYSTPGDPSYVSVRNALATVISFQRDSSQLLIQAASQEDQDALDRFLGVSDGPEDDFMIHESTKLPGSCEWLTSKAYYQSWKGSMDSSFLWLRGRPGAGKSVLSGHVIGDLRNQGLDCCFFFFQARDNVKSTANGCLRSMAWQMGMLHPDIRERLKAIMSDWRDNPIDKIDSHSVWRKIFLSGILKVKLNKPQFWVIDAMDECNSAADMLTFLTRIQEHWPLSILVTSRDPVDAHQKGANPRSDIRSFTISDQDSLQDISLLLKANLAHLPCPSSDRWPTPETIASHILERSQGCFLWASIICSELRQVTSEREITKVMESTPSNMDAVYSDILAKMENARFGKAAAKAFIAWTTYAFRPLNVAEIQTPIEMDINDKIDDVRRTISRCCGSLVYVDQHERVQLVHLTAREFFTRKGVESDFILTKSEGHRRLALVCLKFLLQDSQRNSGRAKRLGSEPDNGQVGHVRSPSPQPPPQSPDPFTEYASRFVFQHLNNVHSNDEELLVLLSDFLASNNLLRWIEFIATNGDLRTVYQAGKTINSLLRRRAQHSPPVGLARRQGKLALLEKWGDDLIHLITNFSGWLRRSPRAIHHLIPPFCPPDSAIRRQFTSPIRGLNVQGLSSRGWDDCIATITYAEGMKPKSVAAGQRHFAVGMRDMAGQILVYDDTIFQEVHTLYHREPVFQLAFAENGELLASAGAKTVRIWSSTDGAELVSFKISSLCLSLGFVEEDAILRVVTKEEELIEWDVESNSFLHPEAVTWTADLPERIRVRTPILAELGLATHLLAISYRGEDIIFWDCIDNRIYDSYEKNRGSVRVFGSQMPAGSTTVRAAAFGHALDSDLFAATYGDGDLVVYDIVTGEAIALAQNAGTTVLAASPDGRTLAGTDSNGNFTLFEFETLRPLYRVLFDTRNVPSALCFTSDSLRFIEIRGNQCRVWEPTVLLRMDMQDDDNSDTISVSTGPQEVDHQIMTKPDPRICSIACSYESSVVFCGTEDGSVFAYDISGPEPQKQLLFTQSAQCGAHLLHFDDRGSILACGDHWGRFTARRISRPDSRRTQKVWEVGLPLIEGRSGGQDSGVLRQVLVSSRHERLLVSTDMHDTLWPVPKQGEGVWICQNPSGSQSTGSRWICRPGSQSDRLLRISDTGQEIKVYDWTTLALIQVLSLSLGGDLCLDRFSPLSHPNYFATRAMKISKTQGTTTTSSKISQTDPILLWDYKDAEDGAGTLVPRAKLDMLPSKVAQVVGSFGARLVLYTTDHWVASVELQPPVSPGGATSAVVEGSFVRHFFLPNDWVGSMVVGKKMIYGIGRGGEILLARKSELAVIKRGLEVTEDGGTSHPRRPLYNSLRPQSGGRIPYRHRAASSIS
ncbi:vegetative incompatibility protein HET-E-1 [Achaetomium macrosporum]|uniref:Vegetative incompatibility protein HET-E-1 n=1 Tax=Achaetomium macrosporum TaxID=79813 RepID=A0AAN7C8M6_9PEZI|nr:vegetative incompatibility protein HET-E-1 [Achaetomium macrosporum]